MAVLRLEAPQLNILGLLEGIDFAAQLRSRQIDDALNIATLNNVNSETAFNLGTIDGRTRRVNADASIAETNARFAGDLNQLELDTGQAEIGLRSAQTANANANAQAQNIANGLQQQFGVQLTQAQLDELNASIASRNAQAANANASAAFTNSQRNAFDVLAAQDPQSALDPVNTRRSRINQSSTAADVFGRAGNSTTTDPNEFFSTTPGSLF